MLIEVPHPRLFSATVAKGTKVSNIFPEVVISAIIKRS